MSIIEAEETELIIDNIYYLGKDYCDMGIVFKKNSKIILIDKSYELAKFVSYDDWFNDKKTCTIFTLARVKGDRYYYMDYLESKQTRRKRLIADVLEDDD